MTILSPLLRTGLMASLLLAIISWLSLQSCISTRMASQLSILSRSRPTRSSVERCLLMVARRSCRIMILTDLWSRVWLFSIPPHSNLQLATLQGIRALLSVSS